MKISEKSLELLTIEPAGKARHHVSTMQDGLADTIVVGWSAAGQVALPVKGEEARPVQIAGVIGIMAARAHLLISCVALLLQWIQLAHRL